MQTCLEIDIDCSEEISEVKGVIGNTDYFFIFANRKNNVIGFYLLVYEIENP